MKKYYLVKNLGEYDSYDVVYGNLEENIGFEIDDNAYNLRTIQDTLRSLDECGLVNFKLPFQKTLYEDLFHNPYTEVIHISERPITLKFLEEQRPELII